MIKKTVSKGFQPNESAVAMCVHDGRLCVATSRAVYATNDDGELEPLDIVGAVLAAEPEPSRIFEGADSD